MRRFWVFLAIGIAFAGGYLSRCLIGAGGAPAGDSKQEALPATREAPPKDVPRAPGRGKWRPARREVARDAARDSAVPEEAAALMALPYLKGYRDAEGEPVIATLDPARAWPGVNLVLSGHAPEAILMDLEGRVLHRWRQDLEKLWPELYPNDEIRKLEYWRRAFLYDNGDLLAIFEGLGLVKLDRDSKVLWARRGGYHHDLEVHHALKAGEAIWVLDREGKLLPRIHPEKPILEDFATRLSPAGKIVQRISLLRSFENSPYVSLLHRMPPAGDVFHTNTLELLTEASAAAHPAFRPGYLLVSVLELDTVAVIDPQRETVVWALTGMSRKQHQPTLLASGNLLLFDNLGPTRPGTAPRSRILELDPQTLEVRWQYGGGQDVDFFSRTLGSSQRLPNGNTLITESENGRALEVTKEGEIVWEFYNPHRAGENEELIAVLFEVLRLDPDFPFLDELEDEIPSS